MNRPSVRTLWERYRRRKSILGIVSDFVFLAFIVALLVPTTRRMVSTSIIRLGMFQPKATSEVVYIAPEDLEWNITSLMGEKVALQFPTDKPVFINFLATWCPPCIAELPALQRLYNQYGAKVDFYFISDEEPQTLKAFLETKGYTIPVYTITDHVKGRLYSRSIPTSFLISPNGRLLMNKTGAAKWDGNKVKNTINYYLKNK